jgi:hypothetical protein
MAFALYVDIVPEGGGPVSVTHVFWGDTEEECRATFESHAKGCEFLTPAIAEGRIEEEIEEVDDDERPEYDEETEEEARQGLYEEPEESEEES